MRACASHDVQLWHEPPLLYWPSPQSTGDAASAGARYDMHSAAARSRASAHAGDATRVMVDLQRVVVLRSVC